MANSFVGSTKSFPFSFDVDVEEEDQGRVTPRLSKRIGSESPTSAVGAEAPRELPNELSAPYEVPQFPIEQIEKKLLIQRQLNVKIMSFTPRSPSYSPSILDNENVISVELGQPQLREWNSEGLDKNPTISPFFYSQGNYQQYFEGVLNERVDHEKLLTGTDQAQILKKKKKKSRCSLGSSTSSYIVRRGGGGGDGGYLIKLEVHELKDSKNEIDYSDSDNACVNVQYVVRETYDDIMEATETLIKKIGKKLCDPE